jgi:hypothetical protein
VTRVEALSGLALRGITGVDAITSLEHALRIEGTDSIDELIARNRDLKVPAIFAKFGQDAGRVVCVLADE